MSDTSFRILKGLKEDLNAYPLTEGAIYYCTDTLEFFIDMNQTRTLLNPITIQNLDEKLGIEDKQKIKSALLYIEQFLNFEEKNQAKKNLDLCYQKKKKIISFTNQDFYINSYGSLVYFSSAKNWLDKEYEIEVEYEDEYGNQYFLTKENFYNERFYFEYYEPGTAASTMLYDNLGLNIGLVILDRVMIGGPFPDPYSSIIPFDGTQILLYGNEFINGEILKVNIYKIQYQNKITKDMIESDGFVGRLPSGEEYKFSEIFNDYINNLANGYYSHAEGYNTQAFGQASHAEGEGTIANGDYSHAEGYNTQAFGQASHAEGEGTIANGDYSHAAGRYNAEDNENKYAYIVGNGSSASKRSNAYTLDWNGNARFSGNVYIHENQKLGTAPYLTKIILSPDQWDVYKLTQIVTVFGIEENEQIQTIYIIPENNQENIQEINKCQIQALKQGKDFIIFNCNKMPTKEVSFYIKWENNEWINNQDPLSQDLIDFNYTINSDNTYTLNSWKGTTNGVTNGTEIIIPSNKNINI